jgi:hypothetical protein
MTFFKIDEVLSNFLHATLALAFAIPAFGMAVHVAKHFV